MADDPTALILKATGGGAARGGGGGGRSQPPDRPPRVYQLGGTYDPAEDRETTRSALALLLTALVIVIAVLIVVFLGTNLLTSNEAKALAAEVLSPVVAVTGTALGFYFGGRDSK